jgi:hypothetical protein
VKITFRLLNRLEAQLNPIKATTSSPPIRCTTKLKDIINIAGPKLMRYHYIQGSKYEHKRPDPTIFHKLRHISFPPS